LRDADMAEHVARVHEQRRQELGERLVRAALADVPVTEPAVRIGVVGVDADLLAQRPGGVLEVRLAGVDQREHFEQRIPPDERRERRRVFQVLQGVVVLAARLVQPAQPVLRLHAVGQQARRFLEHFLSLVEPLHVHQHVGQAQTRPLVRRLQPDRRLEGGDALFELLVQTRSDPQQPVRFGPVIDGWLLTDDVDTVYTTGRQQDVPLLTGMNADEGSAFPGYGTATAAAFRDQARTRFGEKAEQFLRLYPAGSDADAGRAQVRSARDGALVSLQQLAAQRAATAKTPAYLYYFEHAIPWPEHPQYGAFHTGEVPYVFNNLALLKRPWTPVDRRLAEQTSSYWARFARTGSPNGPGLPSWPAFTPAAPAVMVLGDSPAVRTLPAATFRKFFETATN